jgi:hypothetical protein
MYFQEDLSCEWPWSIEFRHKHEARKVLFVIPGDENAGNGLQLLEDALGNRQDYFPPRGVHLANELLLSDVNLKNQSLKVVLVCPAGWYQQVCGQYFVSVNIQASYLAIEGAELTHLISLLKGKYHIETNRPQQAVA